MKTALITGASSGIGLEFANICADNGYNLVLVSRNTDELERLASSIKSNIKKDHAVSIEIIGADLSNMTDVQKVYDFCVSKNITVDYLINNAGFGGFGEFVDANWIKTEQMINLNITAVTKLTHLFLPSMVQRKSGHILNVASTAAFQPGPLMAVYYATKSYVLFFSEALYEELRGTGVHVTCLCPGPTQTGFIDAADVGSSNLFANKKLPSAREVAQFGYDAMMQHKMTAVHGLKNYISSVMVGFIPRTLMVRLVKKTQEVKK